MLTDIYSSEIEDWNNHQSDRQIEDETAGKDQSDAHKTMPELFEDVFSDRSSGLEYSECF